MPDGDFRIGPGNKTSQAAAAIKNAKLYAVQAEANRELHAKNEQLTNFAFSAAHTLRTDWLGVGCTVDEVMEPLRDAGGDASALNAVMRALLISRKVPSFCGSYGHAAVPVFRRSMAFSHTCRLAANPGWCGGSLGKSRVLFAHRC